MKRKGIFIGLALAAVLCAGSAAVVLQPTPIDATIGVVADDTKTALTVKDVNYANIGYGDGVLIGFEVDLGLGYWNAIDTQDKVTLVGSDGTERTVASFESCGSSIYLNRSAGYICSVGDILTLKAGLIVGNYEIKEDISYQYAVANTPWILYTGEEKQEITVNDVNYSPDILGYGAGIVVGFGTDLNLGYWATIDAQDKVRLVSNDGTERSVTVESCGTSLALNRQASYICSVGDVITLKAGLVFGNYELKKDVIYVYETEGSPWVEATLKIKTVNGGAYDHDVYLLNNTSWGLPGIQVNFDTANTFTSSQQADGKDLIEYTRANGEKLSIYDCFTPSASSYFIVRFGSLSNIVYAGVGDVITFKQGFALSGNEKLAQDTSFMVVNANDGYQLALVPEVKAVSLTLNGKIGLNFKFALDSGFVKESNGIKVVYKKGDTVLSEEPLAGKTADSNGRYVCSYPIVPKDYEDNITAELQDQNGNVFVSKTYSIVEYAKAVESGDFTAEAKALVEKAVAYCEASRAYFAGETVTKDETAVDLSKYKETGSGKLPTAITGLTTSLLLESGTEIRVYLYATSIDGLTCTVNGVTQTPVQAENGKWYVSYQDVSANELGTNVEFVFSDGTNNATLNYSALSHANYVLNNSTSDGLVNVMKAMYAYSVATADYMKSLG